MVMQVSGTSGLTFPDGSEQTAALNSRRRNAIINGDFNVWQRGTSFAAATDAVYTADRWVYRNGGGGGVATVSRSTDVPTVVQAGRLFNYSMDMQVTTADSSISAAEFYGFEHRVEGFNWLHLAQRACTLSFWIKAKKTGTYAASLRNTGADRSMAVMFTIDAADTWEFKTINFDASPSAGTWDYTNGIGVYLNITFANGSTRQGTAGSWQAANVLSSSAITNGVDNTANYFRICGAQLEPGSVATAFEYLTYPESLVLCQRYFEKSYNQGVSPGTATEVGMFSIVTAATGDPSKGWIHQSFAVAKRDTPTITLYAAASGSSGNITGPGPADVTAAAYATGMRSFMVDFNATDQNEYYGHFTASAEL